MFVRRVLVGSSGLGIVGTGLWFLISHIKETRNRNWANGLLISISEENLGTVSKKVEEIWDLEVLKWDSDLFKETWSKPKEDTNNIDIKAHFGSWEEARLAFFTKLEEFKKNNKLQDALGPTSYGGNWNPEVLSEFLKTKPTKKK